MTRAVPVSLAAIAWLACSAATPVPKATEPIRWTAVADERVPRIVTVDQDGSERVTKLWLVVLDDQGYIRTGDTRWFRNIQRDPDVTLEIAGVAHPFRAGLVLDDAVRRRVNRAFRDKYGFWDFVVHPRGAGDSHIMRLAPR
jgi:hypothetical protein